MFDLDAYLARIGYGDRLRTDLESLSAMHRAHIAAIPFENLDVQFGRPILLDAAAIQAKMVGQRRGGYCFEQNALFAMALGACGFEVEPCEARVRPKDAGAVLPRTHMVLRLTLDGRQWLADVGFGADGLVEPIALDGGVVEQLGVPYRVVAEGPLAVLQRRAPTGWEDQYAVLPDAAHPADYVVGNWFTSTHPSSPFVQTLTVQRIAGGARHVLRNLTYSVARGAYVETREIARGDLVPLLRDAFGLDVPPDARFLVLDGTT